MKKSRTQKQVAARTRPPMDRIRRIHALLVGKKYPNATQLSATLEVCAKTIKRDIEFMRDRLNLPISFDFSRNGYFYTEEVSEFPNIQITEGELFALVVAEKALQQYRGTTFERPLLSAIEKLASSLPETISMQFGQVSNSISFHTRAEPVLNLEIFKALADATAHSQQLKLHYRKPASSLIEERMVDPYHLGNINGEWYLFAFDHLRKDLRTFVPARIHSVELTGKSFTRPRQFSLEERLRDSFGVVQGSGSYQVKLRFNPSVADYVKEKKWHESQRITPLSDGSLNLEFKLSSLSEVERWVLSWGGNCAVLEPDELRNSIQRAAGLIAKANTHQTTD